MISLVLTLHGVFGNTDLFPVPSEPTLAGLSVPQRCCGSLTFPTLAALEVPDLLAADIAEFFRPLRLHASHSDP